MTHRGSDTDRSKKDAVADDFSYVVLEQAKKRRDELSVDTPKHNAETSHTQRLKQQRRVLLTFATFIQSN